jgi:hypothetical protein
LQREISNPVDDSRIPPDILVKGLTTKADKIRALAKAGYLRTEIADFLGIRYQHVRHVLERSGIDAGRVRGTERVPQRPIPIPAGPSPTVHPDVLLNAGFRVAGQWKRTPDGIEVDGDPPKQPGVYAFVLNDVLMYIGVTLSSLRGRMAQYRRAHPGQRTSFRVNGLIKTALDDGKSVTILIATPEPGRWSGLTVNTAAGLEVGLIQDFRPQWNKQVGRLIRLRSDADASSPDK